MEQNEIDLIHRAQAGDDRAFEALVALHDRRVLQVVHGIMGNRQDAYDAYQNTFIRVHRHLHTFRFESKFSTWLTRIAVNQALNLRKKLKWKRRLSLEALAPYQAERVLRDARDAPRATDHDAMNVELAEHIEASMKDLSDRERTVFVLKHMHGYKLREIAEMIDCAEGTVKNYLFRATQKMRKALRPHYEDLAAG